MLGGVNSSCKNLEGLARWAPRVFLVPHYRFLVGVDGLEDVPGAAILGCAALTAYGSIKKIGFVVEPDDYVAVVGVGV